MSVTKVEYDAQIACVRREIAMRERVYPKWVAAGKMKLDMADREIATMKAVLETVIRVERAATMLGQS